MNILIFGGTGAMGVNLVEILSTSSQNKIFVTTRQKKKNFLNVSYLQGNARDSSFLEKILSQRKYDVIIDFMVYEEEEFKKRVEKLLSSTSQYIFLSSSRVYADSKELIKETFPRLLDVSTDLEYLKTNEYALSKARQEDILKNSNYGNWTIVRPYITYDTERLQLGVYEKERWLYRALEGKIIVFPKDIANTKTTLTYGFDVAKGIAGLIKNKKALCEIVHITTSESFYWKEILEMYLDIIEKLTKSRPKVYFLKNSKLIEKIGNKYQIKYDRLFNRSFDNSHINEILNTKLEYTSLKEGLEKCLQNFLQKHKNFNYVYSYEGYIDRITQERIPLNKIKGLKNKLKYFLYRDFPSAIFIVNKIKSFLSK